MEFDNIDKGMLDKDSSNYYCYDHYYSKDYQQDHLVQKERQILHQILLKPAQMP